ncbi:MAG: PAS domain S-box protein [Bacteroidetes bacterium]|nr:PAS domain S-box protein [Bacteroidota bacterium]
MYILIGLIIAAILQVIAAVVAIWLTKISKSKLTWQIIAVAFVLMASRRIIEVYIYKYGITYEILILINNWIGIAVSVLLTFGVIYLGHIMFSFNRLEKERLESKKRFEVIFNNSSDEIFLADLKGNFLEMNKEAINVLGYSRKELLNMSFRDVRSPKYIDMIDINLEMIIENGQLIYESEYVTKNGKTISVEMNSRIIEYAGEKAILSISRDITERKQMEKKILSAVIIAEEKERERISKEIHDGLGPLLSAIKLYVNELSEEIKGKEKEDMVKMTNEILDEAIDNARTISNNLRPRIIEEYGLVKAIKAFIWRINKTQKLHINFSEKNVPDTIDKNIELILFRVINEFINNTIKHAEATRVDIDVEVKGDKLRIEYRDNGKGFDAEKINMMNGNGLTNINSRVKSLMGDVVYTRSEEKGIKVDVEVPLKS